MNSNSKTAKRRNFEEAFNDFTEFLSNKKNNPELNSENDVEDDDADEFTDCSEAEGIPVTEPVTTDLVRVEVSKVLNVSRLHLDHSSASLQAPHLLQPFH